MRQVCRAGCCQPKAAPLAAAGAAAGGQQRASSGDSSIDIRTPHPGGGAAAQSVDMLRRSASWHGVVDEPAGSSASGAAGDSYGAISPRQDGNTAKTSGGAQQRPSETPVSASAGASKHDFQLLGLTPALPSGQRMEPRTDAQAPLPTTAKSAPLQQLPPLQDPPPGVATAQQPVPPQGLRRNSAPLQNAAGGGDRMEAGGSGGSARKGKMNKFR